ncbi:MAG: hypothetical protein LBT00_01770 [Spirochaetaceae bacterium]|nr:hypothetical protein [Spirochaetaceae bacterium]
MRGRGNIVAVSNLPLPKQSRRQREMFTRIPRLDCFAASRLAMTALSFCPTPSH